MFCYFIFYSYSIFITFKNAFIYTCIMHILYTSLLYYITIEVPFLHYRINLAKIPYLNEFSCPHLSY